MTEPSTLPEQVEEAIHERRLFRRGEKILVAVSGGLDSMVLLQVLAGLAAKHSWHLTVAHFNHQLRGRSSDADEGFVRRAAEKLGLPFVSDRADVRQSAAKNKLSIEMAARKLRHEFFARVAGECKIKHVALAHHADDQVELFFLRLFRGAGGEGLSGAKWKSPSPINPKIILVRPLLGMWKRALQDYARENKISFREDATNAHLDIQRNRIRHELLPLLTKNYQPALKGVITRVMDILGAESEFVVQTAANWFQGKKGQKFEQLAVAVQRRCLQQQLFDLGIQVSFDTIESLRLHADRPVSIPFLVNDSSLKRWVRAPGLQTGAPLSIQSIQRVRPNVAQAVTIQRDTFGILHINKALTASFAETSLDVRLEGREGVFCFESNQINWSVAKTSNGTLRALAKCKNREIFDAAKIGRDIVLRHWQPGDRFQPIGMQKPLKLQDWFINLKVPRARRHELLVGVTAASEIFWVEGLRIGERFKLDKTTRYGLKWQWKRLS